jgi:hypothetical protein
MTHDWRKRLPPSSFSCSFLTTSTRSTISRRLACSALDCLRRRQYDRMDQGDEYSLYQRLACVLSHLLDFFTATPRTHGPRVTVVILFLFDLNVGAVAVYYDGAARFSAAQARPRMQSRIFYFLVTDARVRRSGRHVVRIRCSAAVVVSSSRIGRDGDLGMLRHYQNDVVTVSEVGLASV